MESQCFIQQPLVVYLLGKLSILPGSHSGLITTTSDCPSTNVQYAFVSHFVLFRRLIRCHVQLSFDCKPKTKNYKFDLQTSPLGVQQVECIVSVLTCSWLIGFSKGNRSVSMRNILIMAEWFLVSLFNYPWWLLNYIIDIFCTWQLIMNIGIIPSTENIPFPPTICTCTFTK